MRIPYTTDNCDIDRLIDIDMHAYISNKYNDNFIRFDYTEKAFEFVTHSYHLIFLLSLRAIWMLNDKRLERCCYAEREKIIFKEKYFLKQFLGQGPLWFYYIFWGIIETQG